jgi:hypothetical protein
MSPQELDKQSLISIDEWLELGSQRCKELDQEPHLTKYMLRFGFMDPPFFFVDTLGRIFGKGKEGRYYPFHIEVGNKKYGFKISARAAN